MNTLKDNFANNVFNKEAMEKALDNETLENFNDILDHKKKFDYKTANKIANAMRKWAMDKGCTHYAHWFFPLTKSNCEKHDSFLQYNGKNKYILGLTGRELMKGEPDASSLPNGGLRETSTARGYTSWDYTSYAFIKEKVLFIPATYFSYTNEALDRKIPLLRSIRALEKQTLKITSLLNKNFNHAYPVVGAEQEYFLINRALFLKRLDLIFCERSLFGNVPPKAQQLYDHYFGNVQSKILSFMQDLDQALWKLGIPSKTRHNEVGQNQFELATIFEEVNLATDHNQLIMEMMKKIAIKHELVCLLHEKPFNGFNGSGKHNNWSIIADNTNLLDPQNDLFLVFLTAIIVAVDVYQDLMRISVAYFANDLRLGGNEAPPAIISIYLGDALNTLVQNYINDKINFKEFTEQINLINEKNKTSKNSNLDASFNIDSCDRNRTSPFAFSSNKFEFRMPGSSMSVAEPNITINTIVAEALNSITELIKKDPKNLDSILKKLLKEHQRIIFNGNNYTNDWLIETEKRHLCNFKTSIDALKHYTDEKNITLFEKHNVLSASELKARKEIMIEEYCNKILIEAKTLLMICEKYILPNSIKYLNNLSSLQTKNSPIYCINTYKEITDTCNKLYQSMNKLSNNIKTYVNIKPCINYAMSLYDNVFCITNEMRTFINNLEKIISKECWELPTYSELLFSMT